MENNITKNDINTVSTSSLARTTLYTFLLTFLTARILVFLIMSGGLPDLYMHIGGTHVHHLNYGIFLLSGVGAYLIFARPIGTKLKIVAAIYGIGMALTFDEFGMWLHLGGSYWQRASWDIVVVITAIFALIAFAPSIKKFRPHHWWTAIVLIIALVIFSVLFVRSFRYAGEKIQPEIKKIELTNPE